MSQFSYIKAKGIRKLAKENGKRCSACFLATLDRYVYEKVLNCCRQFNGHKVTLDGGQIANVK